MDWYNDQVCPYTGDDYLHVFDPNVGIKFGYHICQCGQYKKVQCSCAGCSDQHQRIVPTNTNDRLQHELLSLKFRVAALEKQPQVEVKATADGLTQ